MFPQDDPGEFIEKKEKNKGKKTFKFNFQKGEFSISDGRLSSLDGIDALAQWIEKILKTEKFKFKIYETGEVNEYGAILIELVNTDYPKEFKYAEIQREVTSVLLRNESIQAVNNFSFEKINRTLQCTFHVKSEYGEIKKVVSW